MAIKKRPEADRPKDAFYYYYLLVYFLNRLKSL